jgi:hypothetical protein
MRKEQETETEKQNSTREMKEDKKRKVKETINEDNAAETSVNREKQKKQ